MKQKKINLNDLSDTGNKVSKTIFTNITYWENIDGNFGFYNNDFNYHANLFIGKRSKLMNGRDIVVLDFYNKITKQGKPMTMVFVKYLDDIGMVDVFTKLQLMNCRDDSTFDNDNIFYDNKGKPHHIIDDISVLGGTNPQYSNKQYEIWNRVINNYESLRHTGIMPSDMGYYNYKYFLSKLCREKQKTGIDLDYSDDIWYTNLNKSPYGNEMCRVCIPYKSMDIFNNL